MSFILDALKKSEAERQRQAGPALLEMRVVRPQRRFPTWLLVLGGTLLLVNAAGVSWLFLRPANTQPSSSVPATGQLAAAPANPARPVISTVSPPVAATQNLGIPANPATGELQNDLNPDDFEPAASAGAVTFGRSAGTLPNYAEVGGNLPELRLDLHVYAAKPTDRYAFINMRKVREGDITAEGMRVLEITRDGVVLNFRNTEFLLGRE